MVRLEIYMAEPKHKDNTPQHPLSRPSFQAASDQGAAYVNLLVSDGSEDC